MVLAGEITPREPITNDPVGKAAGEIQEFLSTAKPYPIQTRKLTLATCKRWDYFARKNPHKGHSIEHVAIYRDKAGRPIALKVRVTEPEKDFFWIGSSKKAQLFGQHLWGSGGKILTITEGEIDALTVSQLNDHRYPVVSLKDGAGSAAENIKQQLEWVNSFEKVVLMFDMDEPGQQAAHECAQLIAPGKAYIASLPEKDANACLQNDKGEDVVQAVWNAKPFRPDGVVDARELTAKCLAPVKMGLPWPWLFMNQWTFGRRPSEVYVFGSGVGMGKSDLLGEIVACTITGLTKFGMVFPPEGCALFNYEAEAHTIKKLVAGKIASRLFHVPNISADPMWAPYLPDTEMNWTEEELTETLRTMDETLWAKGGKLFINESFGAGDFEAVQNRCRFLRHAEGIKHFVIDPLGALIVDDGHQDDKSEREFLDKLCRRVAKLALELQASFYLVSHLTRPSFGATHEEGGQVRLAQFRGSNGIGMFSNFVFGLERNQQAETEQERLRATVRAVKDRLTGRCTGKTDSLFYDPICGTLDVERAG